MLFSDGKTLSRGDKSSTFIMLLIAHRWPSLFYVIPPDDGIVLLHLKTRILRQIQIEGV